MVVLISPFRKTFCKKLADLRLPELFSLDWLPQRLFTLGADTAAPFSANTMPKGIPNKRYTPEFKKQVVEAVIQEGLSYQEAARIYEVQGHDRIQSWERIYLEEGPEGLEVERRGRRSTGRPKKLSSKVEEDLLAEVQRLRAENAYLKNLQALVLEEERRQRKKRR